MTKNSRRALFLLVATVANMLLTIVIIVAVYVGLSLLAGVLKINASFVGIAILGTAFLAGVVLSFIVYSKILKYLRKRPDLEARFGLLK